MEFRKQGHALIRQAFPFPGNIDPGSYLVRIHADPSYTYQTNLLMIYFIRRWIGIIRLETHHSAMRQDQSAVSFACTSCELLQETL